MGFVAAAARELIDAGVTGDALVTALERIEEAGRPIRSAAAERMIRYRDKKRAEKAANEASQSVTGDAHTVTGDARVTQQPILSSLLTSDLEPVEVKKEVVTRARGRRPSSKIPLPENWRPASSVMAPLTPFGEAELEKMTDWARSNAICKADWDATYRNWMRRAGEQNGRKPNGPGQIQPRRGSRDDIRERTARALDALDEYANGNGPADGGEAGSPFAGWLSGTRGS